VFFENFLSKPFKNRPSKAIRQPADQGFIRQPAETLLMAYTDEKEWPISTSVHNNLQHVPKS
jgi:hypothetical protein